MKKKIKTYKTEYKDKEKRFMFLSRYCPDCYSFIPGFQKLEVCWDCISEEHFVCPVCGRSQLTFMPRDRFIKK